MNKKNPRTQGDTRLNRFLTAKGIGRLAFAKATGYSSQQVRRVRFGEAEPTARAVARYVKAARLLTKDPAIKANDLFPLDDDDSPK
jgi:transcriptional regulator with XRE-family HTH domain